MSGYDKVRPTHCLESFTEEVQSLLIGRIVGGDFPDRGQECGYQSYRHSEHYCLGSKLSLLGVRCILQ